MTGQVQFDRYDDAGVALAVSLVNELTLRHAFGRAVLSTDPLPALERVLAVDPASAAELRPSDVPGFCALAIRLREVFDDLGRGELDAAAAHVNDLLAAHPAHPHLEKEHGHWRLHHHPADAPLLPMMAAICAEGLGRAISADTGSRLGTCHAHNCERVFLDGSKNSSRRFCSTTCQNRVKAATFRQRTT